MSPGRLSDYKLRSVSTAIFCTLTASCGRGLRPSRCSGTWKVLAPPRVRATSLMLPGSGAGGEYVFTTPLSRHKARGDNMCNGQFTGKYQMHSVLRHVQLRPQTRASFCCIDHASHK
ncbi:hypothetical protein OH77DRAFT_907832 [Trametes cingulata]|nr:hypothetical protein OH77DRAFT_907832 [Trametes cingulata]